MKNQQINLNLSTLTIASLVLLGSLAQAATPLPDSGQALSKTLDSRELTFTRSDGTVIAPAAVGVVDADVNIKLENVTVQKVVVSGNTLFATEELQNLFAGVIGNTYTTKQLQVVAARINLYYRSNGFPITRTLLSIDAADKNTLMIKVVEGKFAKVSVVGEQSESDSGPKRFVNEAITPGFPISSTSLERATLLIDDLPGMKAAPILRPGADFGTTDITMQVERTNSYDGRIGWDNAGSRYTGTNRLSLDFNLNSPFMFGDRIGFKARTSNERLRAGELSYELPLTADGWRAELAAGKVDYHLGASEYPSVAYGTATYERLRFAYPLIRSQVQNVYFSLGVEHKKLSDNRDAEGFRDVNGNATGFTQSRTVKSIPLQLRFDRRDTLGGGGITYGALGVTSGRISLDDNAKQIDTNSGTEGSYQRYNFDIARVQRLPDLFSFYVRYGIQSSGSRNLDPSEFMSLGGPDGVRAYPTLEGAARRSQIFQSELRYLVQPQWTGYLFYDQGRSSNPETLAFLATKRTLSGYGIGVRQQSKEWDLDASVAWRDRGGVVSSEDKDKDPRYFVRLGYKF
jgi:hemolysin activation/secretion protein